MAGSEKGAGDFPFIAVFLVGPWAAGRALRVRQERAAALEQRVDQLCARMVELDKLENALEYRLPDGSALDLIDARQTPRKRRNRTGI
ncbi:MAG: hypothetical protein H0W24_09080 [Lysobacter sp.]|nr:hypothetical protein [Lysobacter sp.]